MKILKKIFIYLMIILMITTIFVVESYATEYVTSSYTISTGNYIVKNVSSSKKDNNIINNTASNTTGSSGFNKYSASESIKVVDSDDNNDDAEIAEETEVTENKNESVVKIINSDKAPIFYGTTAITAKINETIDLNSTIYRIFAKDYLGRDITSNIKIVSNTIENNVIGNYEVKYSVSDSEGNSNEIIVPVSITDNDKKIQRTLYQQEDTSHINATSCYRGDLQDSQILGICLESGKNVDVKVISNDINATIEGYYATINGECETFSIANEGTTTLKTDYTSVPLIRSAKIQKMYKNVCNSGYNVYSLPDGVAYFANVYDRTTIKNEQLTQIQIPVYGCTSYKVYVNTENGDLTFDDSNLVYTENDNTVAGYASISLNDVTLTGDKFSIAVEYVGDHIPAGSNNLTYTATSLNGEWKQGVTNIPPIIAYAEGGDEPVIIEIDLSSNCKELNYYRLGDGIEKQRTFLDSGDEYSILDSERLMMLVPKKDLYRIIINDSYDWYQFYEEVKNDASMYCNPENIDEYFFQTFDELLEYYNNIINTYDSYVGLELNPTEYYNKNVLTKFFMRPNVNGAGAAYYSQNEIGNTADTLGQLMIKGWGALHEIGHGYESNWYGRYSGETDTTEGNINLTETANNILAYTYEKNILINQSDSWILTRGVARYNTIKSWTYDDLKATLEKVYEDNIENENSNYFDDIVNTDTQNSIDSLHLKLYFVLNAMDLIESDNTEVLSTLYKNYRKEKCVLGEQSYTPVDRLVRAIYQANNVNKVEYVEQYNLIVSDNVKKELMGNYSQENLLGDVNLDGEVMVNDLVALKKYLIGRKKLYNQSLKNADYNGDGVINEEDISQIKHYILFG